MKKYLSLFSVLFVFIALGCEGLSTEDSVNLTTVSEVSEISSINDNQTTEDLSAEVPTDEPTTEIPTEELTTLEPTTAKNDSHIINQVIVDNDMMKITILEAYEDGIWGYTLRVYHENKSDMKLMFALDDVIVNGYVISAIWANSLPAGAKATETINLSSSDMEDSGIISVDKIDLYMRVYDYDDWMADDLINDIYTIYPTGLAEEEIIYPERPSSDHEYVLIDNEDLTFIILETYEDSIWGYTLKVYLENKTNSELMFTLDNLLVNGYVISSLWANSVHAGIKDIDEISLSSSDMEDSGLTSVDKVDLYMRVYDYNDWMDDDLINDIYTIYPTGLKEEEIISPERPSSDNEYIVVDNEDLKFIIIETYEDSIWGYSLKVYLENNSDSMLMFTWEDVMVNDFAIDPFWAKELVPNSKAVISISFFESDFEENSIDVVEKINFKLKIYDSMDWMADDLINSSFIYRP
ncbi:MAG: hypothetical protein AB7E09_05750 [Candidatus Izemoplasmatales bacterium]